MTKSECWRKINDEQEIATYFSEDWKQVSGDKWHRVKKKMITGEAMAGPRHKIGSTASWQGNGKGKRLK